MPWHEEVVDFSAEILKDLDDYEFVSEHIPSRVALLAKKKFKVDGKWMTWIDFEKWNKLINSDDKIAITEEYLGKGIKEFTSSSTYQDKMKMIIPNLSPLRALSWIKSRLTNPLGEAKSKIGFKRID